MFHIYSGWTRVCAKKMNASECRRSNCWKIAYRHDAFSSSHYFTWPSGCGSSILLRSKRLLNRNNTIVVAHGRNECQRSHELFCKIFGFLHFFSRRNLLCSTLQIAAQIHRNAFRSSAPSVNGSTKLDLRNSFKLKRMCFSHSNLKRKHTQSREVESGALTEIAASHENRECLIANAVTELLHVLWIDDMKVERLCGHSKGERYGWWLRNGTNKISICGQATSSVRCSLSVCILCIRTVYPHFRCFLRDRCRKTASQRIVWCTSAMCVQCMSIEKATASICSI